MFLHSCDQVDDGFLCRNMQLETTEQIVLCGFIAAVIAQNHNGAELSPN
jgi:hypothetical protein